MHMKALDAIRIFDITDIYEIDRQDLVKRYRNFMKKYHPDLCTDKRLKALYEEKSKEINEANEILNRLLDSIESEKKLVDIQRKDIVVAIIPFDKLLDLYNGGELELRGSKGGQETTFKLTESNVKSMMISLLCEIRIEINGNTYEFESIQKVNIKDEYEIECIIDVCDSYLLQQSDLDVRIMGYGKDVKVKLSSNPLKLKLNFNGLAKLNVNIYRKLIDTNDNTEVT